MMLQMENSHTGHNCNTSNNFHESTYTYSFYHVGGIKIYTSWRHIFSDITSIWKAFLLIQQYAKQSHPICSKYGLLCFQIYKPLKNYGELRLSSHGFQRSVYLITQMEILLHTSWIIIIGGYEGCQGDSFHSLPLVKCDNNSKRVVFYLMIRIEFFSTRVFCEFVLSCIPHNHIDDVSTLVQVMALCCQATSHYLNQYWLDPYLWHHKAPLGHNKLRSKHLQW